MSEGGNGSAVVRDGLDGQSAIEKTKDNRIAANRRALNEAKDMRANGSSETEINRMIIDRYGTLGFIPTLWKKRFEAVVRNLKDANPEQIAEAMEFLNAVRTDAPFAFRDFDEDVRAAVTLYREGSIQDKTRNLPVRRYINCSILTILRGSRRSKESPRT